MISRFNILIYLFLILLFLFYISQFSVRSYQNTISTLKLIEEGEDLQIPRKVILIIVDALRYDYKNRMPFIQKAFNKSPQTSFIDKCQVGNPTMTTQRIESLMVGSQIFSSANIFKSFFASKIQTDNLISQLNANNKSSIIFGDDTWIKLFSPTASRVCTNTYNVHDYQSCDSHIYKHMIQQIRINHYDFAIAHFLSVDHVGHSTSSIKSDLMNSKLLMISNFIEKIMQEMDDNMILFVTGDHGMRDDGNHGGSTQQQSTTLFFAHNTKTVFFKSTFVTQITQPDITATLSFYLNVPVPSNAVGVPIPSALPQQLFQKELISQLFSNINKHFNQLFTFYQTNRSKQFVSNIQSKSELQQIFEQFVSYKKDLQFLKYSTPNTAINFIILILITIIVIAIVSQVLHLTYLYSDTRNIESLLNCLNRIMLALTLFTVYFSWNLIQNLSNIFLMVITASIGITYLQKKAQGIHGKLGFILLNVFMLCQIENKQNSQSLNWMKIEVINYILSTTATKLIILSAIGYEMVIRHKEQYKGKYYQRILYIFASITFITTNLASLPQVIVSVLYHCRKIIILSHIWLIIKYSYRQTITKSVCLLISSTASFLFLGQYAPVIVYCCYSIIKQVIEINLSPLFIAVLGQGIWWWMGNRFEYSGVDILKSYIFSEDYHPIINGTTMFLYIIFPHLILFILYNIFGFEKDKASIEIGEAEEETNILMIANTIRESKEDIGLQLRDRNKQFIIVPILALLSCLWNVDYNNQKILFTVVYVPMLLFSALKLISTITMIAVASFILI